MLDTEYWKEEMKKCKESIKYFRDHYIIITESTPNYVRILESNSPPIHAIDYVSRESFDAIFPRMKTNTGKAIITSTPTGKNSYSEKPVNIKNYKTIRYEI